MIEVIVGDALAHQKGIIVHGCNCQGVMGSGIARTIRERYPKVYEEYADHHKKFGLQLGDIQVIKVDEDKYIVNAMTQHLYGSSRRFANYEAIAECFESIESVRQTINPKLPVVFPKIGAGLAQGDWKIIHRIIDSIIKVKKILYVQTPGEAPIAASEVAFTHKIIEGGLNGAINAASMLGYKYLAWNDVIYRLVSASEEDILGSWALDRTNLTVNDLV